MVGLFMHLDTFLHTQIQYLNTSLDWDWEQMHRCLEHRMVGLGEEETG